jgi:hypothetical protein
MSCYTLFLLPFALTLVPACRSSLPTKDTLLCKIPGEEFLLQRYDLDRLTHALKICDVCLQNDNDIGQTMDHFVSILKMLYLRIILRKCESMKDDVTQG